ncbi:MAG: hypothetical protein KGJ86_00590 [Chloroflexota bacterium]|nr:hypothetical protein [Chloroflexota bacterium]
MTTTHEAAVARGKAGAAATHAKHDGRELTAAARRAFLARFTTDEERRAYFSRLGKASGRARAEVFARWRELKAAAGGSGRP